MNTQHHNPKKWWDSIKQLPGQSKSTSLSEMVINGSTVSGLELAEIRELKQRQRRRQRERHEFAYLVGKNNSFARPARAFFTFVHFVAVVSKTTT